MVRPKKLLTVFRGQRVDGPATHSSSWRHQTRLPHGDRNRMLRSIRLPKNKTKLEIENASLIRLVENKTILEIENGP